MPVPTFSRGSVAGQPDGCNRRPRVGSYGCLDEVDAERAESPQRVSSADRVWPRLRDMARLSCRCRSL
jgi:hypothetical protein